MTKTLKVVSIVLTLAVAAIGAGGAAMAGPQANPPSAFYPDVFWGK